MPITMARQLNGRRQLEYAGPIIYEPATQIFTFPDGSQAKVITRYEECAPRITAATTVITKRPVKYWMEV